MVSSLVERALARKRRRAEERLRKEVEMCAQKAGFSDDVKDALKGIGLRALIELLTWIVSRLTKKPVEE